MKSLVFFVLIYFFHFKIVASPCCGQSSSGLNVMTLRQSYSLNVTQSYSQALGRVYDSDPSFYVWPDSKQRTLSLTQLAFAVGVAPKIQILVNSAFQTAQFQDGDYQKSQSQFTDTTLGLSYEFLSEYKFSLYKPTGYLTLLTNLPTGQSVFDLDSGPEAINVSGHDQWGFGLGLTLNKVILPWTFLFQARSMYLSKKEFENSEVGDFFDSSFLFSLSYNLAKPNLVLSLGLTQFVLSSRTVQSFRQVHVSGSRSTALQFGILKSITDLLALSLTYSDQTLLGDPENSLLSQTISLNLNVNYY